MLFNKFFIVVAGKKSVSDDAFFQNFFCFFSFPELVLGILTGTKVAANKLAFHRHLANIYNLSVLINF